MTNTKSSCGTKVRQATIDRSLQVPPNLKYPINLSGMNFRLVKLLSVYLELKAKAKSGTLSKHDIRSVSYYKRVLIEKGLIKLDRTGDHYLLRSYTVAWRVFKIEKSISKNRRHERVFCRRFDLNSESSTRKNIQEVLFQHQAHTLEKQIKYVRNAGRRSKKNLIIEAPLSSFTVAKLFGYKQACTGSRKRKKYFKLVDMPLQKVQVYLPDIDPYKLLTRYKTRFVSM
jgi:hypothetical protein